MANSFDAFQWKLDKSTESKSIKNCFSWCAYVTFQFRKCVPLNTSCWEQEKEGGVLLSCPDCELPGGIYLATRRAVALKQEALSYVTVWARHYTRFSSDWSYENNIIRLWLNRLGWGKVRDRERCSMNVVKGACKPFAVIQYLAALENVRK